MYAYEYAHTHIINHIIKLLTYLLKYTNFANDLGHHLRFPITPFGIATCWNP